MELLFFDFIRNYNEAGASSNSAWSDLIKVLGGAVLAWCGIAGKAWYDAKRENKKKLLVLQLFNSVVNSILISLTQVEEFINDYCNRLLAEPLRETERLAIIINPDTRRIDLIKTEDVYDGFILLYGDSVEAVKDYRNVNNQILFSNEVVKAIYVAQDEYAKDNDKMLAEYKELLNKTKSAITDVLISIANNEPNSEADKLYTDLYGMMDKFVKTDISILGNLEGEFNAFYPELDSVLNNHSEDRLTSTLRGLASDLDICRFNVKKRKLELVNNLQQNISNIRKSYEIVKPINDRLTELLNKRNNKSGQTKKVGF